MYLACNETMFLIVGPACTEKKHLKIRNSRSLGRKTVTTLKIAR